MGDRDLDIDDGDLSDEALDRERRLVACMPPGVTLASTCGRPSDG